MAENVKILIVDDEDNARTTLSDILKEYGYQTFEAKTGKEAIEIASKEKPQVVLLDTVMSGIDGYETCRRMKSNKSIETNVIIFTGKVDAVDAFKAREAGADDYCVKTEDFEKLLEAIKKFI